MSSGTSTTRTRKPEPGRGARRLINASLVLASLGICFAGLEVALRLFYGNPPPYYYPQVRHVRTTYGYKPEPNQTDTYTTNQPTSTNSRGFRSQEFAVPKPIGVVRVMVLGDSLTFGNTVALSDIYTEVLARRLRVDDGAVEIVNASAGGWNLDVEMLFLEQEGLGYEPDILVLAFYPNDWVSPPKAGRSSEYELTDDARVEGRPGWLRWLPYRVIFWIKRPAVVSFLRNRTAVALKGEDFVTRLVKSEVDLEHDPSVTFTISELRRLKRICDEHAVRLVIAAIPPVNLFWLPPTSPAYLSMLEDFSTREGIVFVDLAKDFWRSSETDRLYLYPWDNHLSPAGHQLVSDQLAPVLADMAAEVRRHRAGPVPGSDN